MRRARRILALMIAQNGALNFSFNKRERTCCCFCLLQSITIWWGQYRISHIPASPLNAVCVCVCASKMQRYYNEGNIKVQDRGKNRKENNNLVSKNSTDFCVCVLPNKSETKSNQVYSFSCFVFFLVPVLVFVVVSLRVLAASPLCNVRLTRKPTNL